MMWKAACNQNYKAPENYRQRLCIIHSHLRTLSVADPKPKSRLKTKGAKQKEKKASSSKWTKFNGSRNGFVCCAFASGAGACRPPQSLFEVAASRQRFFIIIIPSKWVHGKADECLQLPPQQQLFKRTNLTFVSKFVAFYVCEYWIMVTQTTNSK